MAGYIRRNIEEDQMLQTLAQSNWNTEQVRIWARRVVWFVIGMTGLEATIDPGVIEFATIIVAFGLNFVIEKLMEADPKRA